VSTRATRGRRPGAPDTRAEVLAAARASFAEKGFRGTTIRAVAAAAGVDPALVHHYFGSKDDLFLAALEMPVDPRALLAPVVAQGPDGAGERLLRTFLSVWDEPDVQVRLLAVVRSVLGDDDARLLKEGFIPVVVGPVLAQLVKDRPEVRIPLVASQVIGLIVTRYLVALPSMAQMPAEDVVARIGPVLQHYLTGDLDGEPDGGALTGR
jgi:AcrR family transcriptional regulator